MKIKKRLDVLLTERLYADSRSKAQAIIMSGNVYVNGQKADKPGVSYEETVDIEVRGAVCPYVSRGGLKLEKALRDFGVKPVDYVCSDSGASTGGFTDSAGEFILKVDFPAHLLNILPEEKREAAIGVLSHDPRPSYQRKPDRIYGLTFAGFDIRFQVQEDLLTVVEVNNV
mgnify:CR=1 FL=1